MAGETGSVEPRPLLGLGGVLLAALTAEFNDGVTSTALIDVQGGLGISHDPGTWLSSLFSAGQVIGMSVATFWALTVSIRRWLLCVIAATCASTVLIPFTSNLGLLYLLRTVQGLCSGFTIPLLLTVALQVLPPPVRLYGLTALFAFLLLSQSASTVPIQYLQEVANFRPEQSYVITVLIAAPRFLLLPAVAFLLDFEGVDARWVLFAGIACVAAACVGNSFLTSVWDAGSFLLWQGLQALGAPLIVMPLLMMSVNTMRGLAEPVGVWMIQLIMRWRGGLHCNRIVDQSGQGSFSALQGHDAASVSAFRGAVQAQATVLTLSDAFLVIACLALLLAIW